MESGPQQELKFTVRMATVDDIPVLVQRHHLVIEEIMRVEDVKMVNPDWNGMDRSYQDKLERQLSSGKCIAYILEYENNIAASGAVSIVERVPLPDDPNCETGYIHSIYTNKDFRRKGYAKLIAEELIKACKAHGIRRVQLKSSKAGLKLYEQLGFKETKTMSLFID